MSPENLHVLPDVLGAAERARADYLDSCRSKRNVTDYDRAAPSPAAFASNQSARLPRLRGYEARMHSHYVAAR
jgi:hypothetical protein